MSEKPERPVFFDAREYPPPTGKLILLTNEETCIIGKWGDGLGLKGWFPLPKIRDDMKRGGK